MKMGMSGLPKSVSDGSISRNVRIEIGNLDRRISAPSKQLLDFAAPIVR